MPKIKVKGQTVQTGERPQTKGRTHGRYQTYYRPCYAVDNKAHSFCKLILSYSIFVLDTLSAFDVRRFVSGLLFCTELRVGLGLRSVSR